MPIVPDRHLEEPSPSLDFHSGDLPGAPCNRAWKKGKQNWTRSTSARKRLSMVRSSAKQWVLLDLTEMGHMLAGSLEIRFMSLEEIHDHHVFCSILDRLLAKQLLEDLLG